MKTKLGWRSLLGTTLGVLAIGCGDGAGPIDTGLPNSTPIAELTDAQAVQACIAFERWERDEASNLGSRRELCTVFAVAFTEDPTSCEAAVQGCLEAEPEPEPEPDDETPEEECADETAPEVEASCDVTVGEFEDCANARIDATQRALSELDCSYAGDDDALDELEDRYEPEICRDIERRCPGLVGDDLS
jgi:hypothetical protein